MRTKANVWSVMTSFLLFAISGYFTIKCAGELIASGVSWDNQWWYAVLPWSLLAIFDVTRFFKNYRAFANDGWLS